MSLIFAALLYMFIGLLVALKHVVSIRKQGHDDFQEQVNFINRMLLFWPCHFYVLLGIYILGMLDKEDD